MQGTCSSDGGGGPRQLTSSGLGLVEDDDLGLNLNTMVLADYGCMHGEIFLLGFLESTVGEGWRCSLLRRVLVWRKTRAAAGDAKKNYEMREPETWTFTR